MSEEEEYRGLKDYIDKNGNKANYTPGAFTIEKFNELMKMEDERMRKHTYRVQMHAAVLLQIEDDEGFIAMYLNENIFFLGGTDVWEAIDERAKKLGIDKK